MLSNIPALILNQNCNVVAKEMSHCHKLKFSNHYIFATKCRRPSIFQTLISVTINNLSLKFQKFKPAGCEDKGIKKFEFVAKTQFLYMHGLNFIYVLTIDFRSKFMYSVMTNEVICTMRI